MDLLMVMILVSILSMTLAQHEPPTWDYGFKLFDYILSNNNTGFPFNIFK